MWRTASTHNVTYLSPFLLVSGTDDYLLSSNEGGRGIDLSVVLDIPPTSGSNFTYKDSLRKSNDVRELPTELKYSKAAGSLNTENKHKIPNLCTLQNQQKSLSQTPRVPLQACEHDNSQWKITQPTTKGITNRLKLFQRTCHICTCSISYIA